jgi:formylglycine-generating enzyme required for sulfatase activity
MSFLQKLQVFTARCGTPAKFVAKTVIGYAVPGSAPLLDLIEKLIDCAQQTARDNIQVDGLASAQDLQRVEKMFDMLLGDLQGVVEKLKGLEHVPQDARQTLVAALRTEKRCLAAMAAIEAQGEQLSALRASMDRLCAGQEGLRELHERGNGVVLDFIEEQRARNIANDEQLKRIEDAVLARARGEHHREEEIYSNLCREIPDSAVLAVAAGSSEAAMYNFVGAAATLKRAQRLRPDDAQLADLSRVATELSRGATPVDPRPDTKKRPRPGDILDGWLLEKLLGFGGWGQVFLARKGDHLRALKIMHAELSQDAEFVKRFKREMGMLIGLGVHPHLVQIDPDHLFDKAHDWNCWYYVMEFVEGITLEKYLERHGPLTLSQAHVLFDGIAAALQAAHERGIKHRDIKPANILIRPKSQATRGRGVLVDFGLAGLVDSHSRAGGYTALFAPLEQIRHGSCETPGDVYALAATIYFCLMYGDVQKRGLFKADLLPAEVPASVRDLLRRCLDNDPDARPKNAGDFVREWCKPTTAEVAVPVPQVVVAREKPAILICTGPKGADAGRVKSAQKEWADWLGIPVVKTLDLGGGVSLEMALVPPGKFMMGSPNEENGHQSDETLHEIELSRPYYVGVHPVTRRQFAQFVREMGDKTAKEMEGGAYVWNGSKWENDAKANWRKPGFEQTADHPVVCVGWNDAEKFVAWLKSKGTGDCRLPTEAQWEFACRAGTRTPYHFGNDLSAQQANFNNVLGRTTEAGSFGIANALGLYDMHGNVWEWCKDFYDDGYYVDSERVDPECTSGSSRVYRGGGWNDGAARCRSAFRDRCDPAPRSRNLGFRLALVPSGG